MSCTLDKVVGGSRAAVLRALEGRMRSVSEIVAETGLSQPNVSNHLARLREQGLATPHRKGKRIFYALTDPDLVRALLSVAPAEELSASDRERAIGEVAPAFQEAVLAQNQEGARSLVNQALSQGLCWQDLYTRVFTPLLVRIGAMWEEGTLSVSEEHAASQLVERMMSHLATLRIPTPANGDDTSHEADGSAGVVVACVEGEHHQIGARMVADFLDAHGIGAVFLGANVPSEALVQYIQRYRPGLVALSAATAEREQAVRDAVGRIRALENGSKPPRILLGGGLIRSRPELLRELRLEPPEPSLRAALAALTKR